MGRLPRDLQNFRTRDFNYYLAYQPLERSVRLRIPQFCGSCLGLFLAGMRIYSKTVLLNESVAFLAQVGFPRLRRGAKGLAFSRQLRNSPVGFRQDGLKHARCPNASAFGFPRSRKLLWLKPPFARKPPDSFIQ